MSLITTYLKLLKTRGIGFFDKKFYLETNPDIAESGMNPLVHYLKYGIGENRLPKAQTIIQPINETVAEKDFDTVELTYKVKLSVKHQERMNSIILENNGTTEFINTYFDLIYVINLRRRQNKLTEVLQKLRKYNISAEIIEAVDGYLSPHIDEYRIYENLPLGLENAHPRELKANRKLIGSPGVWGHLKSNRLIFKDALKKGYRRILILEDDVLFIKNFHAAFQEFTNLISNKKWKILCLGASQHYWKVPDCLAYPDDSISAYQPDQPYYHPVFTFGSFALGVDHTQFEPILCEIDKMNCSFDAAYHTIFQQFTKDCFVAQPNLIVSDNAESDNKVNRVYTDQNTLATALKWDMTKYDYPFKQEPASVIVP